VIDGVCARCAGIRLKKRAKHRDFTCERPIKKRLRLSRSMYSNSLLWTCHNRIRVKECFGAQDGANKRLSGPSNAIPANIAKQNTTVDS